mmetsp:Transcript_52036/g.135485  ORF Transcript_52036/g.135485 Transcript_52036/m.135485 type:complete len:250 (+) Transcript_52036:1719-2468(+)
MLIRLLQEAGEQHRLPEIGVEDLVLLVVLHLHRHAPQRLRPNRAALLHDLVERPVGDLLHQVVRGLLQGDQAGGHPELYRLDAVVEVEPDERARFRGALLFFHALGLLAEIHDEVHLEILRNRTLGSRGGVAAQEAALRHAGALRHLHDDAAGLRGAHREGHACRASVAGGRELKLKALRRLRLTILPQRGAEEVRLPRGLLRRVVQVAVGRLLLLSCEILRLGAGGMAADVWHDAEVAPVSQPGRRLV